MDIGNTIRKLRKERRMSQAEMAKQCDITQTYLSQLENNVKEPTTSLLRRIATVFGLPLPILFLLTLSKEDIAPEKQEAFELFMPSIRTLVKQFFSENKDGTTY